MHRILVVDDDEGIRDLYRVELESRGYGVEVARGIEEALAWLTEGNFQLMILDIRLDGESGLELLQSLSERKIEVPVILSSAYSSFKSDFSSWLAEGYVVKSSDLEELTAEVERVLEKHQTRSGAPRT